MSVQTAILFFLRSASNVLVYASRLIGNNITIGASCENQRAVDERLPILSVQPLKHRIAVLQPLIEAVNIESYLSGVDSVIVGGEYGADARPLHYEWVLDLRSQCVRANVGFEFRQCATHFNMNGKDYTLPYNQLGRQAKLLGIDFSSLRE